MADNNGDGIPDLIASDQGSINVLFGNGNGTFRAGPHTDPLAGGPPFAAGKLSGNGKVDLVFPARNGVAVCIGNGDGTFQSGSIVYS